MSNHIHTILRNRPDLIRKLTNRQIAERLWRLRHETDASDPSRRRKKKRNEHQMLKDIQAYANDDALIVKYRQRLSSISWFMSYLNHRIACRANAEDGVSGRFWEGRFKCDPIRSPHQLLMSMMYIDLNPIRAGMAAMPEDSVYTSVYCGINSVKMRREASKAKHPQGRTRLNDFRTHRQLDDFLSPIDERDENLADRDAPRSRKPATRPRFPLAVACIRQRSATCTARTPCAATNLPRYWNPPLPIRLNVRTESPRWTASIDPWNGRSCRHDSCRGRR